MSLPPVGPPGPAVPPPGPHGPYPGPPPPSAYGPPMNQPRRDLPPPSTPARKRIWPWVVGVALVVIAIVIGSAITWINVAPGRAPTALVEGDETVYPGEAAAMKRPDVMPPLIPLPTEPRLDTIAKPTDGLVGEQSIDATTVVISYATGSVTALDAATGKLRFRTPIGADSVSGCAITDSRIGCVIEPEDYRRAGVPYRLAVLDQTTGKILSDNAFPNDLEPDSIYAASGRFLVTTASSPESDVHAYDTSGRPSWSGRGSYVVPGTDIVVSDSEKTSTPVRFLRISDGKKIAEASPTLGVTSWTVFRGGVAVATDNGRNTDFYRSDGTRTATLRGWRPILTPSHGLPDATPALPLVGRALRSPSYDSQTIGAANPETGHLLWKKSDQQFSGRGMHGQAVGPLVALSVGTPGPVGEPTIPADEPFGAWVVMDPYTGNITSERIEPPEETYTNEGFTSDGTRLIALRQGTATAFDIASGRQAWEAELPDDESVPVVAGQRIYQFEYTGTAVLVPA